MKWIVSVIVGIGVIWGMPQISRASDAAKLTNAWRLMAGYSAEEALTLLEQQPATIERQLALATSLLGKYPQTPANVDQAETLLRKIVKAEARTDLQAAAWYLLGRIEHIFHEGREAEAEHCYRQLLEFHREDQLADSAAVKLALIEVGRITEDQSDADVRRIIEGFAIPRHRRAQGDFHYVLAEFFLERGDLPSALDRLLKVRLSGASQGKNEADLLVQIGLVADELGRREVAVEAFDTFLRRFSSDTRNYMVEERSRNLRAGGAR